MAKLLSITGALLLGLAGAAAAQPADPIPMRDFFRNPDRAFYRISGDGKTLSFMQPWERRMNIFVQPVGSAQEPRRITAEKDRDITDYFWKGANRVVYLKNVGGDENDHVIVVDRRSGEPRDVTPFPGVKAQVIDALVEFPDRMLIGLNKRVKEVFDVVRARSCDGQAEARRGESRQHHVVGRRPCRAHPATRSPPTASSRTYLYRATPAAPFKPVLTTTFRDQFAPQFFTANNRKLYVASNIGRDKMAIVLIDPATGKEERVVYVRDDVDVAGLAWSRARKRASYHQLPDLEERAPLSRSGRGEVVRYARAPAARLRSERAIDDAGRDADDRRGDERAHARHALSVRPQGRPLTKLGDTMPWLPEARMAPTKPISYTTRDGLDVHGYLTLPNGIEPKNLPVIVQSARRPVVLATAGASIRKCSSSRAAATACCR